MRLKWKVKKKRKIWGRMQSDLQTTKEKKRKRKKKEKEEKKKKQKRRWKEAGRVNEGGRAKKELNEGGRRESGGARGGTGGSAAGMDELMDYECLVPNVSGVFAALTSEGGRNLLNQSEVRVSLPTPALRPPDRR